MTQEKVHIIAVGVSATDTVRQQLVFTIYCRTLTTDNEMHSTIYEGVRTNHCDLTEREIVWQ